MAADRFTVRWDPSMGCYRVSTPELLGPIEVVPAADYDALRRDGERLATALRMARGFLGMAISSPRSAAGVADEALAMHEARAADHGENVTSSVPVARLDALAGEWLAAYALLEGVANQLAADAERNDSGTDRRAVDALRRIAEVLRTADVTPDEATRRVVRGESQDGCPLCQAATDALRGDGLS